LDFLLPKKRWATVSEIAIPILVFIAETAFQNDFEGKRDVKSRSALIIFIATNSFPLYEILLLIPKCLHKL